MQDTIDELTNFLDAIVEKSSELEKSLDEDSEIDESAIDDEALRITKLHSKYNKMYLREYNIYAELVDLRKSFKLERWRYYGGKQTDQYYRKYGDINEIINKTDIDRYLEGDEIMVLLNKIVNGQKAVIDCIERYSKELTDRGYRLKLLLDYRKFLACV